MVGGAVACNSFIVLGGVRALIACFKSNLCAERGAHSYSPATAIIAHSFDVRSQMLSEYQSALANVSALRLRAVPQPRLPFHSALPRYLAL